MDLSLETDRNRKDRVLLAASELFAATSSHDGSEARIFAELFRQLLPATPDADRLRIAETLAPYPHTPPACLALLIADANEDVAALALKAVAPLSGPDLVRRIARGPERLRAIVAARLDLSRDAVTALFHFADADTLRALLTRAPEALDDDALAALSDRKEVMRALADLLARRKALPSTQLFALFLDLDHAGRLEAIAAAEARTLSELVKRQDPRVLNAAFKPEVLKHLVEAALNGGAAVFAAHLAYTLDIPAETAARIVDDPGGEPLVVCLRALGTSDADGGRILVRLLGQRRPLAELRDLLALLNSITPRAAMFLIHEWQSGRERESAQPAQQAVHAPVYDGLSQAERPTVAKSGTRRPSQDRTLAPSRREAG